MAKSTKPIPEGMRTLTTQIVAKDVQKLIDFVRSAFGAEQPFPPMKGPDGKIMHGHLRVGDCVVMFAEPGFSPATKSNTFVYVPDVDAIFAKAVSAGAKVLAPVADMFWGDRWGMVEDPAGNVWQIATHVEDVPPEEMMKRMPK